MRRAEIRFAHFERISPRSPRTRSCAPFASSAMRPNLRTIVVTQLAAVIEREKYVGVQLHGRFWRNTLICPVMPEMNQQRVSPRRAISARSRSSNQKFSHAPDARESCCRASPFEQAAGSSIKSVLPKRTLNDAPARQTSRSPRATVSTSGSSGISQFYCAGGSSANTRMVRRNHLRV